MPSSVYSSVCHMVLPLKCHGLSSLIVYLVLMYVCVSVCMPSNVYSSVGHVVLPLKCHGLSSLIVYLV